MSRHDVCDEPMRVRHKRVHMGYSARVANDIWCFSRDKWSRPKGLGSLEKRTVQQTDIKCKNKGFN